MTVKFGWMLVDCAQTIKQRKTPSFFGVGGIFSFRKRLVFAHNTPEAQSQSLS